MAENDETIRTSPRRGVQFSHCHHLPPAFTIPMAEDSLAALREALAVSPTNVPLRLHLADSLAATNRSKELRLEVSVITIMPTKELTLKH